MKGKIKFDGSKVLQTACQAFVSAAAGALGTYVVHKIVTAGEKAADSKQPEQKHKIGFDITG